MVHSTAGRRAPVSSEARLPRRANGSAAPETPAPRSWRWRFEAIAPGVSDVVEASARRYFFARGDVVFRKGNPGESFYIIVRGRVEVLLGPGASGQIVLTVLDPGDSFGETSLADGGPRPVTVVATEPTETLVIDRDTFLDLVATRPAVATALLWVLSQRLRETYEFVEDAVFLDAPGRLAKRLLGLAKRYGRRTPEGTLVDAGLTQRSLARMLGVTRETVNKHLSAFRARGIIDIRSRRIILRRPSQLRSRIC